MKVYSEDVQPIKQTDCELNLEAEFRLAIGSINEFKLKVVICGKYKNLNKIINI